MYWRGDVEMWWPDCELPRVHKWMADRIDSVEKVMRHIKANQFHCCVQAGGYIGMWPVALSKYFRHVHTFEPIPELFDVLRKNTEAFKNVYAHMRALGNVREMTEIVFRSGGRSILDFDIDQGRTAIRVEKVTIDSLDLEKVGLIYLDTERSELEIVLGAMQTIERDNPVVVLELLDDQIKAYRRFMRGYGYRQVAITHRDAIFTRERR